METTGYKLREALKLWGLRKTAAEQAFADSLFKFEGETKDAPTAIAATLTKAETAIATLQVAQMRYNLAVTVEVEGFGKMPLASAIKIAGSAERLEKLWKGVNSPKKNRYDPYESRRELVRDPTQIRAQATVADKEVLTETSLASKRAGALRAAIATGNGAKVNIEDLEPALFE